MGGCWGVVKSLDNVAGCQIDKRGSVAGIKICRRRSTQHRNPQHGTGSSWTNCLKPELLPVDARPLQSIRLGPGWCRPQKGIRRCEIQWRRRKTVVESQQKAGEKGNIVETTYLVPYYSGVSVSRQRQRGGIDFTYLAGNADLLRALRHVG